MDLSSYSCLSRATIFLLIGSFERCPLCGGRDCAVRLGVYSRTVVDWKMQEIQVQVARFLCRRKGPKIAKERSFSVVPAEVIPRRKWSMRLILHVAFWYSDSLRTALDRLSAGGHVVEAKQVYRLLKFLGLVLDRLGEHPLSGLDVRPGGSLQKQIGELCSAFQMWKAVGPGPPGSLVVAWQQQYGSPLLRIRMS